MPKKEVIQYLKQKISEGYTLRHAEEALRKEGYSEKEIIDILNKVVVGKEYKVEYRAVKDIEKLLKPLLALLGLLLIIMFSYAAFNILTAVQEESYKEFNILGDSMLPTLKNGQKVFVDEDYYQKNNMKKGDMIALKLKTQEKPFVKRIIALSGDKLEFKNNKIYINSKELEEPYLYDKSYSYNPQNLRVLMIPLKATNNTVPKKTVFVLGDNRAASQDSTELGFLPEEYVAGKVIVK